MSTFRTRSGRILTDSDIQKLADEAERGYDTEHLMKRGSKMDTAQQKVCDRLWEVFDYLCTAAELEANQEKIQADDLETLVRVTSQAGINYRYHANTAVGTTTSTPKPAVAWRNAD